MAGSIIQYLRTKDHKLLDALEALCATNILKVHFKKSKDKKAPREPGELTLLLPKPGGKLYADILDAASNKHKNLEQLEHQLQSLSINKYFPSLSAFTNGMVLQGKYGQTLTVSKSGSSVKVSGDAVITEIPDFKPSDMCSRKFKIALYYIDGSPMPISSSGGMKGGCGYTMQDASVPINQRYAKYFAQQYVEWSAQGKQGVNPIEAGSLGLLAYAAAFRDEYPGVWENCVMLYDDQPYVFLMTMLEPYKPSDGLLSKSFLEAWACAGYIGSSVAPVKSVFNDAVKAFYAKHTECEAARKAIIAAAASQNMASNIGVTLRNGVDSFQSYYNIPSSELSCIFERMYLLNVAAHSKNDPASLNEVALSARSGVLSDPEVLKSLIAVSGSSVGDLLSGYRVSKYYLHLPARDVDMPNRSYDLCPKAQAQLAMYKKLNGKCYEV